MKLLLLHTDLQKAGINDMSSEELTIGKMWQGIIDAPLPFELDVSDQRAYQKVFTVTLWCGDVLVNSFRAEELIDAIFDAYQYVVNYESRNHERCM